MGTLKAATTCVRSIALMGTAIIFALSIWTLVIVQAMDRRGATVLSAFKFELGVEATSWTQYITAAVRGITWSRAIVVLVMAPVNLLVILSNRYYWCRISTTVVLLMELTTGISSIAVLGCALNLALSLKAFTNPPLPTLDSAELSSFATLNPLSRALTIASALVSLLLITTFTTSFISLQTRRKRANDTRAFEPTISALGMSHGFHALHPQPKRSREPIPTMYDPYRAFRKGPGALQDTRQAAFADEGTWISRKHVNSRWSASTSSPRGIERDIIRLLDVKKARRAVPVRPVRPLSGMRHEREGNSQM
ncbi:hypothetical protein OPT61_g4668 [Boeremia exigua]|uniref:Uncharacterized protein n=1 Tax=Boeremia exigua TaxID=749465 RepID=A0ACC2ID56_9PLEO|nr:hypothetical protein OPT61_g4668 [Boeremia exigua]